MPKLPAFQFYPGDWMKDPALRRCSPAARGVWMDMLCLMFECDERGVLISAGVPWTDLEIAAVVSGDTTEVRLAIDELLRKGVAHRRTDGAIFSRRMIRDEQERKQNADRQRKFREASNGECNAKNNGAVTPPSQRSSSSPSGERKTNTRAPDIPSPDSNLEELKLAVEKLSGTKSSAGWQMEDRIAKQAHQLRGLGFSAKQVLEIAKKAGVTSIDLGFVAEKIGKFHQAQINPSPQNGRVSQEAIRQQHNQGGKGKLSQ